jgi:hypothetical protein
MPWMHSMLSADCAPDAPPQARPRALTEVRFLVSRWKRLNKPRGIGDRR